MQKDLSEGSSEIKNFLAMSIGYAHGMPDSLGLSSTMTSAEENVVKDERHTGLTAGAGTGGAAPPNHIVRASPGCFLSTRIPTP